MARKGHHEEELPFVALMDTMTNVVGVLIIVLVVVGIGLARSVNKVLSELPPVTAEEYARLKKEVTEAAPKDDPKKVEQDLAALKERLKKSTEDLQTLDTTKEHQQVKIIDLDDLQKQLAARKAERDQKKTSVEKLLAEVDQLKARLDTTPIYQPPPATVVKLPNPRALPEKAEIQRFLVVGGRILYTNEEELSKLIEAELKKSESQLALSHDVVKGADGNPVMQKDKAGRPVPVKKTVYDSKKVADYFAHQRLGSRELKLDVIPSPTSPRIPVRLTPLPGAGETIDQARKLVSSFHTLLTKFKADPKTVVWFYVFKDSIDTYLAARDLTDQAGVPAGWELTGNPFFVHNLAPEFAVDFTPPPPPTGPKPVVTIAPPKTTLD